MPANKRLLVLPGDGIGPEVMREVRRVIDWMDKRRMVTFDVSEDVVGGASIDAKGTPIHDNTMQAAKDADAILFGSVGGPKWDKLGFDMRPEIAILRLRKELDLFANLRPATVLDPLVDASTLKADVVRGLTVTSWPSLETDLRNAGAIWVDQEVAEETNLITSRKPADVPAFNRAIIEAVRKARPGRHTVAAE